LGAIGNGGRVHVQARRVERDLIYVSIVKLVPESGHVIWGLGFRVWCLVFGVQGLGLGVWGFVFGV